MLDGSHFSWWMNGPILTVNNTVLGWDSLQLLPEKSPEKAAEELARQMLLDATEP